MAPQHKPCSWATSAEDYLQYHDVEWGTPLYDDHLTFEFLLLETFQAGLSWIMILRRREAFRKAFHNFDVDRVSAMTEHDVNRLCNDTSIVRNRAKIRAAVENARAVIRMREEGMGLAEYFWRWVGFVPVDSKLKTEGDCPPKTELAERVSQDLKRRGFRFVGATVVYAHLQATGIVNDHTTRCERYEQAKKAVRGKEEWTKMGIDVGKWGDGKEWWEKMERKEREEKEKRKMSKSRGAVQNRTKMKGAEVENKKRKRGGDAGDSEGNGTGLRRSRRIKAQSSG